MPQWFCRWRSTVLGASCVFYTLQSSTRSPHARFEDSHGPGLQEQGKHSLVIMSYIYWKYSMAVMCVYLLLCYVSLRTIPCIAYIVDVFEFLYLFVYLLKSLSFLFLYPCSTLFLPPSSQPLICSHTCTHTHIDIYEYKVPLHLHLILTLLTLLFSELHQCCWFCASSLRTTRHEQWEKCGIKIQGNHTSNSLLTLS